MKNPLVYSTITYLAATLAFGVGLKTTESVGKRASSTVGMWHVVLTEK